MIAMHEDFIHKSQPPTPGQFTSIVDFLCDPLSEAKQREHVGALVNAVMTRLGRDPQDDNEFLENAVSILAAYQALRRVRDSLIPEQVTDHWARAMEGTKSYLLGLPEDCLPYIPQGFQLDVIEDRVERLNNQYGNKLIDPRQFAQDAWKCWWSLDSYQLIQAWFDADEERARIFPQDLRFQGRQIIDKLAMKPRAWGIAIPAITLVIGTWRNSDDMPEDLRPSVAMTMRLLMGVAATEL